MNSCLCIPPGAVSRPSALAQSAKSLSGCGFGPLMRTSLGGVTAAFTSDCDRSSDFCFWPAPSGVLFLINNLKPATGEPAGCGFHSGMGVGTEGQPAFEREPPLTHIPTDADRRLADGCIESRITVQQQQVGRASLRSDSTSMNGAAAGQPTAGPLSRNDLAESRGRWVIQACVYRFGRRD